MGKLKEHDELIQKKAELLRRQEMYRMAKETAKKELEKMDYGRDYWRLQQLTESIYQNGEKGDKKLLERIVETSALIKKQEHECMALVEKMEQDYKKKEKAVEAEIGKISERLRKLETLR